MKQISEDGVYRKGSNLYVNGTVNGKSVVLARYIANCYDSDKVVDHKNSDTLDNRTENLEIVDGIQNTQNKASAKNSSSTYVGVFKWKGRYIACLTVNKERVLYKYCDTEEEAVFHRDETARFYNKTHNTRFKINIQ